MVDDTKSKRESSRNHSRRRMLKVLGGASTFGLTGLAGCTGGDSGGDGSDSGDSGGDGSDSGDSGTGGSTGSMNGGGSNQVHIVTNESTPEAKAWFDGMGQKFMEEEGSAVIMDYTSLQPQQRISTLIQTGNTPELATLDVSQAAPFALNGQLESITDLLTFTGEQYGGTIPDTYRLQVDGEDKYMPLWTNPDMWWTYSGVYEDAGVELKGSMSWDELLAAAKALDSDDINGVIVPSGSTAQTSYSYWSMLMTNGGKVAARNSDGDVVIDLHQGMKDKAMETLQFLKDLHQYSPEAGNYNWGDNINAFVSQTGAHINYAPRAKLAVIDNRPELSEQVKPIYPVQKSEPTRLSMPGGWTLFNGSDNVEGAKKFLRFVARENRLIDLYTNVTPVHNWPTIDTIPGKSEYRNSDFISKWFTEEDLNAIQTAFENGQTFGGEVEPYNPFGASLFASRELGTMVHNVNINDKDIEQAIMDTGQRLEQVLSDVKSQF